MAKRNYTSKERQTALKMADKIGLAEASRKLGISNTTICKWRSPAKKAATTAPNHRLQQVGGDLTS